MKASPINEIIILFVLLFQLIACSSLKQTGLNDVNPYYSIYPNQTYCTFLDNGIYTYEPYIHIYSRKIRLHIPKNSKNIIWGNPILFEYRRGRLILVDKEFIPEEPVVVDTITILQIRDASESEIEDFFERCDNRFPWEPSDENDLDDYYKDYGGRKKKNGVLRVLTGDYATIYVYGKKKDVDNMTTILLSGCNYSPE